MKNKLVKSVTENLFKNRGGSGTQDFPSSLALRLCTILIFTLAFRGQASAAETPEDAQSRIDNLEQRIQRMEGLAAELEALKAELAKEKQKSAKDQKPAEAQSPSAPGTVTVKDGGLALESADGNANLQFNGRVQADYRSFVPDEFAADTFSVRRARLGGTVTFLKDYTVRVEGGSMPEAVHPLPMGILMSNGGSPPLFVSDNSSPTMGSSVA